MGKIGKRAREAAAAAAEVEAEADPPPRSWADGLPPELLEKVARAVPAGDHLWFRLACRSWAAAGAGAAAVPGERPLPPGKLTRTRGADAAASVARAEMVLAVLERPARPVQERFKSSMFKSRLCTYSAKGGHLAVLQWARAQGCFWYDLTCAWAARNGHLKVLQWARAQGCPWNKQTCAWAAKYGHLEVLQWARAQGCPWDWRTCAMAAREGQLDVLKWARANGCPWDEDTCAYAAMNGNL